MKVLTAPLWELAEFEEGKALLDTIPESGVCGIINADIVVTIVTGRFSSSARSTRIRSRTRSPPETSA